MTDREKIDEAVHIGLELGGFDGAHHKTYVINAMLKTLMGEAAYNTMTAQFERDTGVPWDEGDQP